MRGKTRRIASLQLDQNPKSNIRIPNPLRIHDLLNMLRFNRNIGH